MIVNRLIRSLNQLLETKTETNWTISDSKPTVNNQLNWWLTDSQPNCRQPCPESDGVVHWSGCKPLAVRWECDRVDTAMVIPERTLQSSCLYIPKPGSLATCSGCEPLAVRWEYHRVDARMMTFEHILQDPSLCIRTVPSTEADATRWPSGENFIAVIQEAWPLNVCWKVRVKVSQN